MSIHIDLAGVFSGLIFLLLSIISVLARGGWKAYTSGVNASIEDLSETMTAQAESLHTIEISQVQFLEQTKVMEAHIGRIFKELKDQQNRLNDHDKDILGIKLAGTARG